jgi:hypothetical protein
MGTRWSRAPRFIEENALNVRNLDNLACPEGPSRCGGVEEPHEAVVAGTTLAALTPNIAGRGAMSQVRCRE